jgi:hypothetical protein
MRAAAKLKLEMSRRAGEAVELLGRAHVVFPSPSALLALRGFPGLPAVKLERLHGVARAALEGKLDAERLGAHAAAIGDLKNRIDLGGVACTPPAKSITAGMPAAGSARYTFLADVMMRLVQTALACDLTRVGTIQWSDSEAKFMLGFLKDSSGASLKDHHHGYQHDRGFQPQALELIYNFYAQKLAYLLKKLDSVQEGNGTLLDNTLVIGLTEIQQPESHAQNNQPFILAGKTGGKLKSQRWLKVKSQPHNNLLVSIMNAMGLPGERTFGDPDFCTGPLKDLV